MIGFIWDRVHGWGSQKLVGLFDLLGVQINPATEDKQDDIIAAIGAASTVGDGTATVTTAGTRVQLAAQVCRKVLIQAHESNTGTIVVGGATVVAALVGRRGVALFPTQSQAFEVSNLNLLYIDSTADGDKINFYYEN